MMMEDGRFRCCKCGVVLAPAEIYGHECQPTWFERLADRVHRIIGV